MSKDVLTMIEKVLSRRAFVGKVATMVGALVTGIFAAPTPVLACNRCCGLVFEDGNPPWPGSCAGVWCWPCNDTKACEIITCYECFGALPAGACVAPKCPSKLDPKDPCFTKTNVIASKWEQTGFIPPPGCKPW